MKRLALALVLLLTSWLPALAVNCASVPNTFTNGSLTDAPAMNANFTAVLNCFNNNVAARGANSDITSLLGLVSPPSGAGSWTFVGGSVTGTANALVVASATPTGFFLSTGNTISFLPTAANTGAATLAVNGTTATTVLKPSSGGLTALTGGELAANVIAVAYYDGTEYVLLSSLPVTGAVNESDTLPATNAYAVIAGKAAAAAAVPWAITGGLPSAMSGTSTTAAITVTALTAADQTAAATISWAGTKSWAVANGNAINGYAGGSTLPNSATIHMYACSGASGSGTYASTVAPGTFVAANCPTNYTSYTRRLFSFTTTGAGAPIPYVAEEVFGGAIYAYLSTPVTDVNGSTLTTANRTLYALSVPSGLKIEWQGNMQMSNATGAVWVTSPDEPDSAVVDTFSAGPSDFGAVSGAALTAIFSQRRRITNTSGQLGVRGSSANLLYVLTTGYTDFRRS